MYFLLKYHETHIKSLTVSWTAQFTMPTIHIILYTHANFLTLRNL